jgi:hypothetical protein
LIEKQIPTFDGELWVHSKDNSDEVSLECADHVLGNVAAVHVRWKFLVLTLPFVGDVGNVRSAGFIVKYLEFYCDATFPEALHNVVVSQDMERISPYFEQFHQDSVGANVVGQHDVVVTVEN